MRHRNLRATKCAEVNSATRAIPCVCAANFRNTQCWTLTWARNNENGEPLKDEDPGAVASLGPGVSPTSLPERVLPEIFRRRYL